MEIRFEYTAGDFAEVQIAATKLVPALRRSQRLPLLVGTMILVSLPVVLATGGHISYLDPRIWIVPALGLYMVLAATVLRPFLLKRHFRKNPHIAGTYSAKLSVESIQYIGPESRSEMSWSAIDCYAESKNVFALVRLPNVVQMLPKRAFTPEQLAEFRELLRNKLPSK